MDLILLFSQLTLLALGVLGVSAADPGSGLEQASRALICLVVTVLVTLVPPRTVVRFSPLIYVLTLALLVAVLFVGVAPGGSSSRRWLLLGGFTLQPSELMKVAVIAYLAGFFYRHLGDWQLWRPMVVVGLAAGAIVAEPDVSTAAFLFMLAFAVMLAAGTTLLRLVSITTAAALIAVLFAGPYLSQFSYIGNRISGFQDLWGDRSETATLSYQASQAQRSLVAAGVFGLGPGRPLRHVPEAHTDMVAISVAHSLGFLGVVTMIGLFFVIAARGMRLASALSGPGALLAFGATAYLCGQAALNLLVAVGLFPVTGIPLPFVSYGFNAMLSASIAIGFIHSGYRQLRREEREGAAA
ncbi:MAG: FtsW/RodA/SpoVE family cell cycle protein [Deinococcota bacterium]|nr:FtsW/RodA/SpoVE family cell cycle protein [Deinococcota bacterium]